MVWYGNHCTEIHYGMDGLYFPGKMNFIPNPKIAEPIYERNKLHERVVIVEINLFVREWNQDHS